MARSQSQEDTLQDGRARLESSASSTDSRAVWISLVVYLIALGLWLYLADGRWVWIIGTAVAVFWGGSEILDLWRWNRRRPLRTRLGEIAVSVSPYPARIGDALDVQLELAVRSRIQVHALTMRLQCDGSKLETYGIRYRQVRVWSRVLSTRVFQLQDATHEADEMLTAHGQTKIPAERFPTSEWTRWWLVLEATIAGCPSYEATFPLEVAKGKDDAPDPQ